MSEYYIGWWNLENLFDANMSPQRALWLQKHLRKELKGWTRQVVAKKIRQLRRIILQMNSGNGPDILGICEIENERVVEKLVESLALSARNYRVAHHDTSDKRGIDVAFIYDSRKFTTNEKEQFHYEVLKRTATRDIFQVNFKLKASGRDLVLVGNHWPSRSGGRYESEPYRIIAAETLSYWMKRILEIKGEDVAVLVMGDFNDQPYDRSMTDYALSTRSAAKVRNARTPMLYNLMWPLTGQGRGTYYFANFPNMLDQFLVSKGMLKRGAHIRVVTDSVSIQAIPEMTKGRYKVPRRFGRPSSKKSYDKDGFSDHFPISVILKET